MLTELIHGWTFEKSETGNGYVLYTSNFEYISFEKELPSLWPTVGSMISWLRRLGRIDDQEMTDLLLRFRLIPQLGEEKQGKPPPSEIRPGKMGL